MSPSTAAPLDATRWNRLKEHVADLSELDPSARRSAFDTLPLDADDRAALARLLAPLLADDARLSEPHPAPHRSPTQRWMAGDIVGAYRIDGLIGSGGMGEVYEARSIDGDRLVALKILRLGLAPSHYARFSENEQRALQRLDDPRIARFIEAFPIADVGTCLVLECVDGEPLQTYCRGRRFDVAARLKLFIEVCHAVAGAHQQLIVHRDLKPGNVLVTPEGEVKLLDFGVAKLLDDVAHDGQTHGDSYTLDFAAPEQVLRDPVSTATDIYALGVMLFCLLTDVSPYAPDPGGSVVKAVLDDPPQRFAAALLRSRAAGNAPPTGHLDRDLERIVIRAMEKQPKARYRTALEIAADVQAVLDRRPIAGGGGAPYRISKFVRRNRAAVGAAVVAVIALVSASVFSMQAARRAELHAHRAEVSLSFLLGSLDLTDRFSGNNRSDYTLGDVLQRALAQSAIELRNEPEVRASVLVRLSYALQHQGESADAFDAAREAYAIRTAPGADDDSGRLDAAQRLASIELERGLLDDAENHLADALRLLPARGATPDAETISVYTSLGKLASMRGRPLESLEWYQRVPPLRAALEGDHRVDQAMDHMNLGTGHYNVSVFHKADADYQKGIALLRETLPAQHPRLGLVLASRSAPLTQLGRFDEASGILDEAEVALASGNPDGSAPSANTERSRALLDLFASDYASALRRLDVVAMRPESSSPLVAAAIMSLRGRVQLASGDVASATETLAQAEALYVKYGRGAHSQRWFIHGLRGAALATADGDVLLDEALRHLTVDVSFEGVELAELLLLRGASARRAGDADAALAFHRRAADLQRRLQWLGPLGAARVNVELAQDSLMPGTDRHTRADALRLLAESSDVLAKVTPHDPQLPRLFALRADHGPPP